MMGCEFRGGDGYRGEPVHTLLMRFAWILALGVALAGCRASDSPITRAAGSWQGQFQIDAVDGKADAASIKSEELDANLELYVTGDKFELDATARHQKFSVIGKWTAAPGGRITMTADSYTFDNPTDEDQRALGLRSRRVAGPAPAHRPRRHPRPAGGPLRVLAADSEVNG